MVQTRFCPVKNKGVYMKVNRTLAALAGAALLLGSSALAQESYDGATSDYGLPDGFSFSYTLSTDVIKTHNISSSDNDLDTYEWWADFGGLVNKFNVRYYSNLLAFQLAPKVKIGEPTGESFWNSTYWSMNTISSGATSTGAVPGRNPGNWFTPNRGKLNADDTGFGYDGFDWNIRFTPFDIVDVYLNTAVEIAGGGLPIGGGRFDAAKLGSDGLTVVLKPISGLRLAASLPFTLNTYSTWDMLFAEDEDDASPNGYLGTAGNLMPVTDGSSRIKFQLKFGADYNYKNLFSIGATWDDILDASSMKIGAYANITAIHGLDAGLGYTFNRKGQGQGIAFDFFGLNDFNNMFKLYGQHVVQLYAQYLIAGRLTVGAEAAFNLLSEQSVYDMYVGAQIGCDLGSKVNLGVKATVAFDFGTQLQYTDNSGAKVNPLHRLAAANTVADEAYKNSFLKNTAGSGETLYRFANRDWKIANTYKTEGNDGRGYQGEQTDWTGYQAATVISVQPSLTYTTGHNVFSGAVAIDYLTTAANDPVVDVTDENVVGDWFFKFPISWTYNF